MKGKIGFIVVMAVFVNLLNVAFADFVPPPPHVPTNVKVGLLINNIVSFDQAKEAIEFVGTLTEQWTDQRLAYLPGIVGQRKDYPEDAAKQILVKIWHPELVFMKPKGPLNIEAQHIVIYPDGTVTYMRRFLTTIELPLNLSNFPFDKQRLRFTLMPLHLNAQQVQLHPLNERQGIVPFTKLSGWNQEGYFSGVGTMQSPITHEVISYYFLEILLARAALFYIFQIMVPLILIVIFSFSVFWMLHNPLVNRVAISLTALLTIVVFQWRVFNQIPQVNYHIFLDVFMLISFVIAGLTLVASVLLEYVKQEHKNAWILTCRIAYPVIYFLIIGIIVLIYF